MSKKEQTHARLKTTTVDGGVSAVIAILTTVTTTSSSNNKIEYTRWANSRTWRLYYTHIPIVCLYILSNSLWSRKTPQFACVCEFIESNINRRWCLKAMRVFLRTCAHAYFYSSHCKLFVCKFLQIFWNFFPLNRNQWR